MSFADAENKEWEVNKRKSSVLYEGPFALEKSEDPFFAFPCVSLLYLA